MSNPPAFPVAEVRLDGIGICEGSPGMSLRDWFAGQALAGDVAASHNQRPDPKTAAQFAYDCADAMLAQREPTP